MENRMKPAVAARLFQGKPLMNRSAYARRLALLWVFTFVWCGVFFWAVASYAANSIWLTVLLAAALFLMSPDPPLLTRSYSAYRREWDRDNQCEQTSSSEEFDS